jgi:hypothetical protein
VGEQGTGWHQARSLFFEGDAPVTDGGVEHNDIGEGLRAIIYFWAPAAHYFGHISGLPFVRTLLFAVSGIAMLVIFWRIVI